MVQDVKELSAELNVERFRDFFDVGVFDRREIEVDQAGPDYAVSPGIAKKIHAGVWNRDWIPIGILSDSGLAHRRERSGHNRNAETAELQVVVNIAGVDRVAASGA